MWFSFALNLLVVTLQRTLNTGSHKVLLTENRTVGVYPRHDLGAHFIVSAPGAKNPSYAIGFPSRTLLLDDGAVMTIFLLALP